jgi:hypothetical protein
LVRVLSCRGKDISHLEGIVLQVSRDAIKSAELDGDVGWLVSKHGDDQWLSLVCDLKVILLLEVLGNTDLSHLAARAVAIVGCVDMSGS